MDMTKYKLKAEGLEHVFTCYDNRFAEDEAERFLHGVSWDPMTLPREISYDIYWNNPDTNEWREAFNRRITIGKE